MYTDVVLITGGTGAIGKALCLEFQAAGQCVMANCHPSDLPRSKKVITDLQRSGAIVELLPFDVTDTDACKRAIEDIEARIGAITVAVNAAGITRDATLRNLEPGDWNAVIRTNLDSVYNICRPVCNVMCERGYGRIINISSVSGQRGQFGQTNYSAAKAGMTGFTKALAREVAKDGITVNSVSPGYVQSPMIEKIPAHMLEKAIEQIPVGRFAQPEEIAHAVGFLASKDSGYITGIDLSINGGFHIA